VTKRSPLKKNLHAFAIPNLKTNPTWDGHPHSLRPGGSALAYKLNRAGRVCIQPRRRHLKLLTLPFLTVMHNGDLFVPTFSCLTNFPTSHSLRTSQLGGGEFKRHDNKTFFDFLSVSCVSRNYSYRLNPAGGPVQRNPKKVSLTKNSYRGI